LQSSTVWLKKNKTFEFRFFCVFSDFCSRFQHTLTVSNIENLDLSYNPIEDKGLTILNSSLQQRKLPINSLNLQFCGLTQKSLYLFNTSLITNQHLLKSLKILNFSGNRIKEENVRINYHFSFFSMSDSFILVYHTSFQ